jgi:hypothetical protein
MLLTSSSTLRCNVVWPLLQPNDPPVACPRFSYWNWEHGRCVGNLEFDVLPSRVVEQ